MSQMFVFHSMMGSYVERSLIQRKLSPRSWIALGTKLNIAIQIGICMSIGRQPAIGLTPYFEYSIIIACCFCIWSSGLLRCFVASSSFGFSTRIFADDM